MKSRIQLAHFDDHEFTILRRRISGITSDGVRDYLSISCNTWKKISKGHAASARIRERLVRYLKPSNDEATDVDFTSA